MLLQPYRKSWANDFRELKKVLVAHIPTDDIQVEHIGSTSIKGLAAKPIIDIDIVYEKSASFNQIKKGLEELGYYHNGDQGIQGREVFKRKKNGEKNPLLDSIEHHLYVCQINSEELQRHLIFRDYLRAHETARTEYAKLKYLIAEKTNQDKKAYTILKEVQAREFVISIIKKSKER